MPKTLHITVESEPGRGKSTIAHLIHAALTVKGLNVKVQDDSMPTAEALGRCADKNVKALVKSGLEITITTKQTAREKKT